MPNPSSFDFESSFNFNSEHSKNEEWERIEENCDREEHSYAWGLVHHETVDCPDNKDDNNDSTGHSDNNPDADE